jgi:hypothetical protein
MHISNRYSILFQAKILTFFIWMDRVTRPCISMDLKAFSILLPRSRPNNIPRHKPLNVYSNQISAVFVPCFYLIKGTIKIALTGIIAAGAAYLLAKAVSQT